MWPAAAGTLDLTSLQEQDSTYRDERDQNERRLKRS